MAAASIVVERRVEWSDTDASGIHHNTFIVRLAEAAEGAMWRAIDLHQREGNLPRVRLEIDFLKPLWAGDLIEGHLRVAQVGRTSLTYDFEARRGDDVVARAKLVAVRVVGPEMKPTPWPDDVKRMLETIGELPAERFAR